MTTEHDPAAPWPIWVISLADAAERRGMVRAQFDELKLPFAFLDAVDGRKGLPAELESEVDRAGTVENLGHRMSDAEYACALSHQHAYRKLLAEGWAGAIILEDDVLLTDRFLRFYENRSYEAADFIQLFYFEAVTWKMGGRSIPEAKLESLVAPAWMAVGYSLSRAAAAKIRAECTPLRGLPDWPCDTTGLFNHYITEPRIVLHPVPTLSQSSLVGARKDVVPDDFDFSAGYAKGWRRLLSLASWQRLLTRPFKIFRKPGFTPTGEERASLLSTSASFISHASAENPVDCINPIQSPSNDGR